MQLLVEKFKPLTMCLRKHCSNNKEKSSICFHFVSIVSMEITSMEICDFFFLLISQVCVLWPITLMAKSILSKFYPSILQVTLAFTLKNVAITDLLNYPACLNGLLDICLAKQGEFVSNHLIFLWFSYYDRSVQSNSTVQRRKQRGFNNSYTT